MTPLTAPRGGTESEGQALASASDPGASVAPGSYVTMPGLRARGWTDAMVREFLDEPDATQPNPRYRTGAPMKLYLAARADAAEATARWAERAKLAASRRAAGGAAVGRKQAAAEALAGELAADLVGSLVLPADPERAAIDDYNRWHADGCTCPGWRETGCCDKRAAAGDPPEFLRRVTVGFARRRLTGYARACDRLARRLGQSRAHDLLRAAVNAAIEAELDAAGGRFSPVGAAEPPPEGPHGTRYTA